MLSTQSRSMALVTSQSTSKAASTPTQSPKLEVPSNQSPMLVPASLMDDESDDGESDFSSIDDIECDEESELDDYEWIKWYDVQSAVIPQPRDFEVEDSRNFPLRTAPQNDQNGATSLVETVTETPTDTNNVDEAGADPLTSSSEKESGNK